MAPIPRRCAFAPRPRDLCCCCWSGSGRTGGSRKLASFFAHFLNHEHVLPRRRPKWDNGHPRKTMNAPRVSKAVHILFHPKFRIDSTRDWQTCSTTIFPKRRVFVIVAIAIHFSRAPVGRVPWRTRLRDADEWMMPELPKIRQRAFIFISHPRKESACSRRVLIPARCKSKISIALQYVSVIMPSDIVPNRI